jgi:hypothetical protein
VSRLALLPLPPREPPIARGASSTSARPLPRLRRALARLAREGVDPLALGAWAGLLAAALAAALWGGQ